MVELLSEPLYILAQARMRIGLRVRVEAAATVAKIAATLLLLWSQLFSEAVALSVAQVGLPPAPNLQWLSKMEDRLYQTWH